MTKKQLKNLRSKLGLTQQGLDNISGYSRKTIQAFELGYRKIPKPAEIIFKKHLDGV